MGISIVKQPTTVQIIRRSNDLVLVQWTGKDDILRRNWVASNEISNEKGRSAEVIDPASGIPEGVEFWRLVTMKANPKDLDRELKVRGIWTAADVRSRPNEVISALMAAYGVDLATLILAVDQYEKDLTTEA